MISVVMAAARSAPRSEPANSHDLRPSVVGKHDQIHAINERIAPAIK
jgi:hypothetical protein